MNREQSDGEGSVAETGTDRFVDATAVDMEPDWIRKDVPIHLGAVDLDAFDPDPETQCRFGPPNRVKPKWPRNGLPLPHTLEPCRQLPGAGARPVGFGDGRRTFGISSTPYPGLAQRRPNAEMQLKPDLFAFGLPTPAHLSPDKQSPELGTQSGVQPVQGWIAQHDRTGTSK